MPPKYPWLWTMYFFLLLAFVSKELYDLFAPDTQVYLYYLILRVFDPAFYVAYTLHVARIILSAIHCLPLLLYAYRIRFLNTGIWKCLFIFRCVFDLTGHSFDANILRGLYYARPGFSWIVLALAVIPNLPSYAACYWYAFRQEKIFRRN